MEKALEINLSLWEEISMKKILVVPSVLQKHGYKCNMWGKIKKNTFAPAIDAQIWSITGYDKPCPGPELIDDGGRIVPDAAVQSNGEVTDLDEEKVHHQGLEGNIIISMGDAVAKWSKALLHREKINEKTNKRRA